MSDCRDQYARQLSYGWQKTLTLAIGLATQPKLLLFDEPITGIAPTRVEAIGKLIRDANEKGVTICLIEHNVNLLMSLCDRIVALNFGQMMADGLPDEVATTRKWFTAYLEGKMTRLRINDLCVNYGMLEAVKNVSMEVPEGKVISLLGANGSGKSTILKSISGLKDSRQGEIFFGDTKINGREIDKIVDLGISLIPEGRRLFPYMSVLENLNLGRLSTEQQGGDR